MPPAIRAAILTISDRCSRGEAKDTSGPALAELITTTLGAEVVAAACVPDDLAQIAGQLLEWATREPKIDLILTTGGTGLGPRDLTPEATLEVLQRRHPGLLELARLRCLESTQNPRTFLSRGEAGSIGQCLVINLPGSERGAREFFGALADVLPHAIEMLRGGGHG
jgi:molybdenum cofactor synthesis domain-containing protein